ncbi:hypothetical protein AAY473_032811 [Plecturocebus cupreus]
MKERERERGREREEKRRQERREEEDERLRQVRESQELRQLLECSDASTTLAKTRSHYVAQAGIKLLGSSDPPAPVAQSTGITNGVSLLLPRLVSNGTISAHRNLCLPETGFCHVGQAGLKLLTSDDPPASASQSAGIIDTRFHHVDQAGLELLTTSDPPASASQSAGIIGVTHCNQPGLTFLKAIQAAVWALSLMPFQQGMCSSGNPNHSPDQDVFSPDLPTE